MKKFILFALTALCTMSLFSISVFADCDNCIAAAAEEPAEHCSYYCTNDSAEKCSCGDTYIVEYCKAVHQYTYTSNGTTHTGTCACGKTVTENHTYLEATVVAPDCATGGYTLHTCSVCDYYYEDNQTPAKGHAWKETDQDAATCTKTGVQRYECETCGESMSTVIPLLPHTYKDTIVAASCESGGWTHHECTVCGYEVDDNQTEALGHNYVLVEGTDTATCQAPGQVLYRCNRTGCGEEQYRSTPKAAHKFVNGICTMCGGKEAELPVTNPVTTGGGTTAGGSSGATGGNSGGSSSGSFDDAVAAGDVKRLFGILAVAGVTFVILMLLSGGGRTGGRKRR